MRNLKDIVAVVLIVATFAGLIFLFALILFVLLQDNPVRLVYR